MSGTASCGEDNVVSVGYLAGELPAADVRRLESLGADSLWTAGHIATGGLDPEVITGAARLAVLTEKCLIGTAVVLLPLYQPAVLAKQLAEIDRFGGGRLVVGVGVGGEFGSEFSACQIPVGERGRRANEAMVILKRLWTGDTVSYAGEFTAFEGVRVWPAPQQRGGPPLIVGGRSDHAMRRAAVLGDGWLPFFVSPRRYKEQAERLRTEAGAHGRDLAHFAWMNQVIVALGSDTSKARAAAMEELAARDHPVPEEMFDRLCAVGPPEAVAETLQAHLDAGVQHLVLVASPMRDSVRMAETIATAVLPQLRRGNR